LDGEIHYVFDHWSLNSTAQTAGQETLSFRIEDASTAVAVYRMVHNLRVQSSPITGVRVSGTPAGITNYSSSRYANSFVTLKAVSTAAGGYAFVRWNRDGANQTPGKTSLSFTISHDTTVTANYKLYRYLKITGPTRVYERSHASYRCYLFCKDGTCYNITNYATWSDSSSYVRFAKPGYLTTSSVSSNKRVRITAKYAGRSYSMYVTVRNRP
jgi:hypothetical protein